MSRTGKSLSALPGALDERILALHAAIDRESLWSGVRDLLAAVCAFERVTLFLGHLGMGEARLVYTDPPIERASGWFEERGKLNPFSPWIAEHVGVPYYRFRDIVGPPEVFRQTRFYREFAQAEGWDKGLSVMFWNREEMRAMFSLYRSEERKDFSEAELGLVLTLARHIEIAIVRVQKIHRDENFRGALQSFARTLPAPLLLLDWKAKLDFANRAAYESAAVWNYGEERARSFNARDCFRVPGAIVEAVDELKKRIQTIEPKALGTSMPEAILVQSPRGERLKARVSPVHFGQNSLARPGFFVLFQEPVELSEDADPETLAKRKRRALQALTPAEREVVQHICRGARNAEIAAALSKSVLTVKTQVNSIFQKLGIKSRSELVARLK